MKNLIRAVGLFAWLIAAPASAQQYENLPPNSIVANLYGFSHPGWAVSFNDFLKVLNLYSVTKVGDLDYQIKSTDRVVTTDSTNPILGSHTWTLPASTTFGPGQSLYIADLGAQTSSSRTITIQRTGSDFINGGVAPLTINSPNAAYILITDGAGHWLMVGTINGAQSAATANQIPVYPGGGIPPAPTSATTWFDAVYCNTIGYLLVRTTGSWTCSKSIVANPLWWGADPTGVSDSAPAINSALASGVTAMLPAGTFRIASAIAMQPNSRLTCQNGATITQANGANLSVFIDMFSGPANGAQLDHCTLDGNRANNTGSGSVGLVHAGTASNVRIVFNTIKNAASGGISGSGTYPYIVGNNISNVFAAGIGLSGATPSFPMYGQVRDNTLTGAMSHAIYLYQCDRNDVSGNTIAGGVATGGAQSAMNVTVSGSTATWVSGTNFAGVQPGQFLLVNGGVEFAITAVNSNTSLTLDHTGTQTNVAAAIGNGDLLSLNNVSYTKVYQNKVSGGITGGIVLSQESASTESAVANTIEGNLVEQCGEDCIGIAADSSFGSTVVYYTSILNNKMVAPNRSGSAGTFGAAIGLQTTAGNMATVIVDGNQSIDPNSYAGGFWLSGHTGANATNVTFGDNSQAGFANGELMSGYPKFASLPVSAAGKRAFIIDGLAASCGDTACTTWGTTATAGGGALKLNLWHNGANWTLVGK
ncbi:MULTISPECIES: glycoside hydrolase family 55 protein [unclassified Bradyrhizobium]|uniref:glycoside hydrolase family 55 protein n=1 Tax=unclassified Bradyrhizobium TaxID=2631580 RepID=UPI001FF9D9D9|nr:MULTISPECIES: glycoside hydrolase family 55 protein [unclassified Bradyrhizobium]MCK1707628.1 right-handed parallel beta-helix repeat-containing protein [Bradyrhizobium sp. 143]MCK1724839.1 right-handed parallel beta-helix repeat-containing protein [Bradyrhizobium sp. 142]